MTITDSIKHIATYLVVLLEAFAVTVKLRVFKLCIAKLGQDLLTEATSRLCDAGRDAPAVVESIHSAYSGVVGAELLFVLTQGFIDLTMASRIADLLRKLVYLGRHVVRKVRPVVLFST